MKLRRLPNGNLLIPVGVYIDGIMGDAHVETTPEDPRFAEWAAFIGGEWDETDEVANPLSIDEDDRVIAN